MLIHLKNLIALLMCDILIKQLDDFIKNATRISQIQAQSVLIVRLYHFKSINFIQNLPSGELTQQCA